MGAGNEVQQFIFHLHRVVIPQVHELARVVSLEQQETQQAVLTRAATPNPSQQCADRERQFLAVAMRDNAQVLARDNQHGVDRSHL